SRDTNEKPSRRPAALRGPISPLWFGAVLFGLLLVANAFSASFNQAETLDYSAFKSLLAQGRIAEVQISTDTVRGKYQDADGAQRGRGGAREKSAVNGWANCSVGCCPYCSSSDCGCSSSAA